LSLAALGALPARAADPPALVRLLTRAGEHVRRVEQNLAFVIGDEEYRQRAAGRLHPTTQNRRTRAEILFMWMPDEGAWLTVRNVLSVDGRPVPDSQRRLSEALGDSPAARLTRLRPLLDESARFNLGQIVRNINYPTQALTYLDPVLQPRFAFALTGRQRVNGIETSQVAYEERTRPTLIRDDTGSELISRGAVWIDDRNGVIMRTKLEITIPLRVTIASVEVDFRHDARLDLWVPGRMHETYLQSRATMINESIDCVASYSNFRRFETSGRVVK
jgi:hypothetical protein